MLASEVQQRVHQEVGMPEMLHFTKGSEIDIGWLGVLPVAKLTKLKKAWQRTVHVLAVRATSGQRVCKKYRQHGGLAMRVNMKVTPEVLKLVRVTGGAQRRIKSS